MKRNLLRSFLILAAFTFCFFCVSAQTKQKNDTEIKSYIVGETLTYEGKFSKAILRGIEVADLSFTVERAPDGENYFVRSEAKSKGTLIKLFRFTFLQQLQSTIDFNTLDILKSIKHDVQNERERDSEAIFNYADKQVTYVEIDPKNAMRPPRKVASQIEAGTQDFISGLYLLRSMPLAVGKTFELTVSEIGLVYKIPVRVTARVRQKSVLGKLWCFRVEPEIFGKNRLIDQEGSMIIWITDDNRRIPVRSQINAEIGRVEVKLKSVSYKTENK
ncbi:hypothetical protein BH10ACI1_BH10ACI1_19720 [soil metagenome]